MRRAGRFRGLRRTLPALPLRLPGWFNAAMTARAWPEDWTDRMAGKDCPLCGALGRGDDDFSIGVFAGEVAEVRLERRSRLPGYCIVVWRLGHVAEPTDLDPGQASRYWAEVMVQPGQDELHDPGEHRPSPAHPRAAPLPR